MTLTSWGRTTAIVLSGVCFVGVVRADAPMLPPAGGADLSRENPANLIAQGDDLYKKHQLAAAHDHYLRAAQIDPKNIPALVKDGEVLHDLADLDNKYVGQDRAQYMKAVTANPDSIDALQHLLGADIDMARYAPRGELYTEIRDTAHHLLTLKKDDVRAKEYEQIGILAGWIATAGGQYNDKQIDDALTTLHALMPQDPGNAEVPFHYARTWLYRAGVQQRAGRMDEAKALVAKGIAIFEEAVAAQPKNTAMLFRYAQTLAGLEGLDRPKYSARIRDLLAQARQAAAPDDPLLFEIYVSAAQFEGQHDANAQALKILRDLYKLAPDDQRARLALAESLDRDVATRPEALQILRMPLATTPQHGPAANLQAQTWLNLANVLIDTIATTPADAPERAALGKEAHEAFDKLTAAAPPLAPILKARGRLELMDGGPQALVKAIQTFEQARHLQDQASPGSEDYDLMYLLARTYYTGGQTGPAKTLLARVVVGAPNYLPARVLLTQLQLTDGQLDQANENLKQLNVQAPKDPDVTRLNLAYFSALDPTRHNDVIREASKDLYPQLPEDNDSQKLQKAQVAGAIGMNDDAIRLLQMLRATRPTDVRVTAMLAQVYLNAGQHDQAVKVIADAQAQDPKNPDLALLAARLNGAKPEELNALQINSINSIADPVARELQLFTFYQTQKQDDEAAKHLAAAAQAGPQDVRVLDAQFQYYMGLKRWSDAEGVAVQLTALNADQAKGMVYAFRLAMARNQLDKAARTAEDLTRTMPEFSRSWLALAQVRQAQGLYEQAVAKYRTSLEKQDGNVDALRGEIECYYALNDSAAAKKAIDDALRSNPNSSYFREQESLWQQNFGDPDSAVPPRQAAVQSSPDVLERWLELAAAYVRASQADRQRGKGDAADVALENARKTLAQVMARPAFMDRPEPYSYAVQVEALANNYDAGLKIIKAYADRPAFKDSPDPSVLMATFCMTFGKFPEAEAALKDALTKSKGSVDAQLRLAQFYSQRERPDDALAVLDAKSTDARIQQQIIETYITARRFDQARKLLEDRLAASPNDSPTLARLGSVYLAEGRSEDALPQLTAALRSDPQNATALYVRGELYASQNPPALDQALDDLRAARDQQPRNVEFRSALADVYQRRHEADNMARELEAALRLAPERKALRVALFQAYEQVSPPRWDDAQRLLEASAGMPQWHSDPDWPVLMASMWANRGDNAQAIDFLKQALALAPENPIVQRNYIVFLVGHRNYDEALQALDKALAVPELAKLPWVHESRGLALAQTGKGSDALASFQTALNLASGANDGAEYANIINNVATSINPDAALAMVQPRMDQGDFAARVMGVSLLTLKRDYPGAVGVVEKLLADRDKLKPEQLVNVLGVAGALYMTTHDSAKAKDVYDQLLKIDKDNLSALNNLAYLLSETLGRPQDALVYSRRAIEIMALQNRVSPNILDTHGWTLVLCGKVDDGIIYLQQAIDHDANFIEGYYHLGDALLIKGDAAQASNRLTKALALVQDAKDKKLAFDPAVEDKITAALHDAQSKMHGPG